MMVEEMHDGWYNHPVIQEGALAQLASALPWHGRGQGFESLMLHQTKAVPVGGGFCLEYPADEGRTVVITSRALRIDCPIHRNKV